MIRPSLVAQLVKNLPAMQDTPVQFLGREDLLEKVRRKGNPLTLLVGMQTSTATMENSVVIPLKTGNRTAK